MKRIQLILCCVVGFVGAIWCFFNLLLIEDDYVYFEWSNLTSEQIAVVEEELGVKIPENFHIQSLITWRTFMADMTQYIQLHYSGDGTKVADSITDNRASVYVKDEENILSITYYGGRSNLNSLIIQNGVEHREEFIKVEIFKILLVILAMLVCVLPYRKVYEKLNGL